MKLFSSFVKELKIASRGFYFYIEIFMAMLILVVFLFVVPDNFDSKSSEYLYLDMPVEVRDIYLKAVLDETIDGKAEKVKIKIDKKEHVESSDAIEMAIDNQDVRPLSTGYKFLSDRDNMMPSVLVFNGSLMGLLIIAAYISLDRQEGVIKAYAVTPSSVWQYLMSKIGVITIMSLISSFLIVIPIMGSKPDYFLFLILLLTTGFFSSALGLLTASFFKNLIQSFGAILTFIFLMIIPNVAYFMPSWNPSWIKIIPTYSMLEGFKSILLGNGDWSYILTISGGFLIVGIILFALSNYRYKKTLAEEG